MPYYKFKKKDILRNRIKAHPNNTFFINDKNVYYNNRNDISGAHVENVQHIPTGYVSLYGMNVDRAFNDHTYDPDADSGVKAKIFPFITKNSSLNSFGTTSTTDFNMFQYGDIVTGSYPLSASISREVFATNHGTTASTGSHILALKNTMNHYTPISPRYAFSSSLYGNKAVDALTLISIPSIFYGSTIKRNSVRLDIYISGTLVAACEDIYRDGRLIQTSGTAYAQTSGSGRTAGMVLYNEGFLVLTGSWNTTALNYNWGDGGAPRKGNWQDFGAGPELAGTLTPSASFSLKFQGTTYIQNITMFADAPLGELNFSPNPTYISYRANATSASSTATGYFQNNELPLKNTVSSSFFDFNAKQKRQTFISKIGIYDENRNLIAIANLSKPIKKLDDRDFTFKLKLDI